MGDAEKKTLNVVSLVLLNVGGLNWLLVGLFEWNLVSGLFGGVDSPIAKAIYILAGLAAIFSIILLSKVTKRSVEKAYRN
nr:DUF378 domain-containing protein [Mesobacillus subterraneus]